MLNERDIRWSDEISVLGNKANRLLTMELAQCAIDEGIRGDFAECGVLSGGHPAMMAHIEMLYGDGSRYIHLYDSFQGVPQPGPNDTDEYKKTYGVNLDRKHGKAIGRCIGTLEQVKANMEVWHIPESMLIYHPGWIQEVLANELIPTLALLRVDVDLYDSTIPIFESLYPKMPSGSFIISDDWGESPSAPCRVASIKAMGYEPEVTPVEGQSTTVWWRKP